MYLEGGFSRLEPSGIPDNTPVCQRSIFYISDFSTPTRCSNHSEEFAICNRMQLFSTISNLAQKMIISYLERQDIFYACYETVVPDQNTVVSQSFLRLIFFIPPTPCLGYSGECPLHSRLQHFSTISNRRQTMRILYHEFRSTRKEIGSR